VLDVSHSVGVDWPPSRFPNWTEAIEEAARQWSECVEAPKRVLPILLRDEWTVFREGTEAPLEHLAAGDDRRMCEALLTLHAIADEACAGLGVALDRAGGRGVSIAPAAANCSRERDRWLESTRTSSCAAQGPHTA
jgi:hypothetical protein